MVNLTSSIAVSNITKYQCIFFDLVRGSGTMQFFMGGGTSQSFTMSFELSDLASKSTGIFVNATPSSNHDLLVQRGGVGAASSLTAAVAAYRGAANHNAGLKAIELRGVTDGWLDSLLAGT